MAGDQQNKDNAFGKFRMPSVLHCCWARFQHQGLLALPAIIHQEIKFARMLTSNKIVQEEDLIRLLVHMGVLDADEDIEMEEEESFYGVTEPEKLKEEFSEEVQARKCNTPRKYRDRRGDTAEVYDYDVTVKDMTILFDKSDMEVSGEFQVQVSTSSKSFDFYRHVRRHYSCSNVSFENCIFITVRHDNQAFSNVSTNWEITKSEETTFTMSNCFLRGVNTSIEVKTALGARPQRIRFQDTIAIGPRPYLSIFAKFDKTLDIHKRYQMSDTNLVDASLCRIIIENCQLYECLINAVNLTIKGKTQISEFNLTVQHIKFAGNSNHVINKTRISELYAVSDQQDALPRIVFGPYQSVTPPPNGWQEYKDVLMDLREIAEKRKDEFQAGLLNREIMKCDHALIRQEKVRFASIQDRLTLWVNEWLTDYGVSWLRPLGLLVLMNMGFAFLVAELTTEEPQVATVLYYLSQAFNPISNPFNYDGESVLPNEVLSISLHVAQKALFALFLYEIIRVGRRHTRHSNN